jgi:hypothetical protein
LKDEFAGANRNLAKGNYFQAGMGYGKLAYVAVPLLLGLAGIARGGAMLAAKIGREGFASVFKQAANNLKGIVDEVRSLKNMQEINTNMPPAMQRERRPDGLYDDRSANGGPPKFSLKFTEVNGVKIWESPAGLRYGPDPSPNFVNRVRHVMNHAADIPNRPGKHGVFDSRQDALPLVDEAWVKVQNGDPGILHTSHPASGAVPARDVYVVPMGRKVGYVGGVWGHANGLPDASYLRIVVEHGNSVVSAFPVIP